MSRTSRACPCSACPARSPATPGGRTSRIWFALVTLAAIGGTAWLLRDAGPATLRAVQFATVFPVCALTMATGGDDMPVLALCLLALALCAVRRFGGAGLAVGSAAALKLFAWPIAAVLIVHAATRGRSALTRLAAGAVGLPLLALVPPALVDPRALVDNVVGFPLGQRRGEQPGDVAVPRLPDRRQPARRPVHRRRPAGGQPRWRSRRGCCAARHEPRPPPRPSPPGDCSRRSCSCRRPGSATCSTRWRSSRWCRRCGSPLRSRCGCDPAARRRRRRRRCPRRARPLPARRGVAAPRCRIPVVDVGDQPRRAAC